MPILRPCIIKNKLVAVVASLGGALAVIGALFVLIRADILEKIMDRNLLLINTTAAYPDWKEAPIPILTSLYFFNVTNADEVQNRGRKPVLVELGPYTFQEFHNKTILGWNYNNTVTYKQTRTWKFMPNETQGSLDDLVVTLNVPAVMVNSLAMKHSVIVDGLLSLGLEEMEEQLFVAKTVRELAFEGYTDPILTESSKLPSFLVPQKMDKFGYFYPRNGSDWFDGVFNMYTGEGNVSLLGQISQWNYTHQLPFFPGKCGEVRGAGDVFNPGLDKTFIELFSNDLCRPLRLDYSYEDKVDAVRVNNYRVSEMLFANKTQNPDNACYNPENEIPSGLFNVSTCRFGAPMFISQPHFYQADSSYVKAIKSGIVPNKFRHETSFNVDPLTGVPVQVAARFQVNFLIQPISNVAMFKNIRKMFFPTVWFQTKFELTPDLTNKLWLLSNVTSFCSIIGLTFLAIAIVLLALIISFMCTPIKPKDESDQVILNQSLFNESDNSNMEDDEQLEPSEEENE